ncbi:hypothetical protein HUU53_01095 [Candidatus Micrarchaeota archaeon]|nr:hypothetical protein [Candidatus Micrarchaeota archaeon]
MEDQEFQTSVDNVFDFIKSNKKVTINQLSKAMSISPAQIEKLVKILEASKLIDVSYGLNEVFLSYKEEKGKEKSQDVLVSKNRIDELNSLVDSSVKVVDFARKDFLWKVNAAEMLISKLEKEDLSPNERQKILSTIDRLNNEITSFVVEEKKFLEQEKAVETRLSNLKARFSNVSAPKKKGLIHKLKEVVSGAFTRKRKPVKESTPVPVKPEPSILEEDELISTPNESMPNLNKILSDSNLSTAKQIKTTLNSLLVKIAANKKKSRKPSKKKKRYSKFLLRDSLKSSKRVNDS